MSHIRHRIIYRKRIFKERLQWWSRNIDRFHLEPHRSYFNEYPGCKKIYLAIDPWIDPSDLRKVPKAIVKHYARFNGQRLGIGSAGITPNQLEEAVSALREAFPHDIFEIDFVPTNLSDEEWRKIYDAETEAFFTYARNYACELLESSPKKQTQDTKFNIFLFYRERPILPIDRPLARCRKIRQEILLHSPIYNYYIPHLDISRAIDPDLPF